MEWLLLALALALIAANGMFVAAEFSMVAVDRATVERAADAGDRRAGGVLAALRSLSTQLSGAQLGITVTSLVVGYLAAPSLGALLRGPLSASGLPQVTVTGVAVGAALLVATMAQMVFGELVPKNLAIARPLPVARAVTGPQRAFTAAARHLIAFLNGTANQVLRLVGIEPQEELRSARTSQELRSLVRRSAQRGTLSPPTADLVGRSLAFGDLTARDVMTPRFQVTFASADDRLTAVVDAVEATGHSRFPVIHDGMDDVVGIVHVKHILAVPEAERARRAVADVMVEPLAVPGSLELDPLLRTLREQGLQMAVVVDEYGGTDGVVTLEDLVEELVGEIADEHDRVGAHARRRNDGSWSLSGLLRPDEIADITGVRLPEGEQYDTLAGLVLDRFGRIPAPGDRLVERVDDDEAHLTVERIDGRRVSRVRLAVIPGPAPETEGGERGE